MGTSDAGDPGYWVGRNNASRIQPSRRPLHRHPCSDPSRATSSTGVLKEGQAMCRAGCEEWMYLSKTSKSLLEFGPPPRSWFTRN